MNAHTRYQGQKAALGTKHNKETVIAPLFKSGLGIDIVVPKDFDTDIFGTFTLDTQRPGNQIETAIQKAQAAMDVLGLPLGIASEGSFETHPSLGFGTINTEIAVFIDRTLDIQIVGSSMQPVTYAQNALVSSLTQVQDFANQIGFPDHGIVIRKDVHQYDDMLKGITDWQQLTDTATRLLQQYGTLWIETDFRAHVNKSRMRNIRKATEDLVSNIKRTCPSCGIPGFAKVDSKPGLPCETCGHETSLPLADIYRCKKCAHQQEVMYPNQKQTAYAGYCDYCNP